MIEISDLGKRIFQLEEALLDIRDICERSSISGLKTGDRVFDVINKALKFTHKATEKND